MLKHQLEISILNSINRAYKYVIKTYENNVIFTTNKPVKEPLGWETNEHHKLMLTQYKFHGVIFPMLSVNDKEPYLVSELLERLKQEQKEVFFIAMSKTGYRIDSSTEKLLKELYFNERYKRSDEL